MQARFHPFLKLAVTLIASLGWVNAGTPTLPVFADPQAIDAYLTDYVRTSRLPGLSVAVMRNGEVVLAKGYGRKSLEANKAVTSETPFAIGSISKQFTCAAILLLAEEGRLSVQDKVAKYYPSLTRAADISLLDLMNHVSGYPDYYPLDFVDRRMQREIEPDELLRQYAGGALDFEPGSRYSYSNTGYVLLGRVVEKVAGEPFGTFLSRRILKPLGMNHTSYEPDFTNSQLARGYKTFLLSDPEPTPPEAKGWIGAAGAIYSTPSDLAKWNLALMSGQVLKPDSYALMTRPRKLLDGRISEYGCGLALGSRGNRPVLTHNGAVSGFTASSLMIPSTKSAVIMTCNLDSGLGGLPGRIFGLLIQEPLPNVPVIKGPTAVETTREFFGSLQKGQLKRGELSEEFNLYFTDARLAGAAERLARFGPIQQVELLTTNERGGMEVTTTRLTFNEGTLKTLMYRKPDGKIEQFFVDPE